MKTAMALLLVLALALPLTAQAADDDKPFTCADLCDGRKGPLLTVCKEGCELQNHANQLVYARFQCHDKCVLQKGITPPAKAACEQQCEKDYKLKAAGITAACNKSCTQEEVHFQEVCRQACTPPS